MKRPLKTLLIAALSCALLIAIAGIIKFNFLDTPYDGEPISYVSANGETIIAHFKTDNSVDVSGHDFETVSLDSSPSASGARYSNQDGSFIFWAKGDEVVILKDDIITFRGSQESAPQNALAGSIWKYTGSEIDGVQLPVARGTLIILNFDNSRLFGEASCNSFFGSYQYHSEKPEQITFSDLGSSRALCENTVMEQESHFFNALSSTSSITFSENSLSLHYGTDKSLQFKLFGTPQ
jgi:heat shock protein HslJ